MSDNKIQDHYNDLTKEYTGQYDRQRFVDRSGYIANYVRLQHILNLLSENPVKSVLDAGCGEGSPLIVLAKSGYKVAGFDFSKDMVKVAKENIKKEGLDDIEVGVGDLTDILTYSHLARESKFDACVSLGVFPHIQNENLALKNIRTMVKPDGLIIVEFRNDLFNMFALNSFSKSFFMKNLFSSVEKLPVELRNEIEEDISSRFAMNYPELRETNPDSDAPGYDAILAKFHNPFEIPAMFEDAGIQFMDTLFYNYHAYPPYYKDKDPDAFTKLSLEFEHENSGWKGLFMASAFLAVGRIA
jgi:2-polyprenyl-3-methyl-5-hydroxy-6-metoxy-1,4-benzoquinol methylase